MIHCGVPDCTVCRELGLPLDRAGISEVKARELAARAANGFGERGANGR